jgi:hypothetical protein
MKAANCSTIKLQRKLRWDECALRTTGRVLNLCIPLGKQEHGGLSFHPDIVDLTKLSVGLTYTVEW